MKKILSLFLAALMLTGCMIITTSAEGADMQFSTKGSTGRPDDLVTYEVYCDKSGGTYAARLEVYYDIKSLSLVSFENGEVWSKSEYTSGNLNETSGGRGFFTYYAETKDVDGRNDNTGLVFTLTFQILKSAVNGDHNIELAFTAGGDGYFFYQKPGGKVNEWVDLSVECTKQSAITVFGSDATASSETNDDGVIPQTDPDETTKTPVTAYVTDDEGKLIKNEKNEYETYVVTDKNAVIPEYVFDTNGEPVTDTNGDYVTRYEDTTGATETTGADGVTDSSGTGVKDKNEQIKNTSHKVIIMVSIIAVVVAAVIIIIVVTASKKKDGGESAEEPKNDDKE